MTQNATSTGWGFFSRIALRFFFVYFLLYSLPLLLRFPVSLASSVAAQVTSETPAADSWFSQGLTYLSKPGEWFQQTMSEFPPWACRTLLEVEVEPSARITGSGDGLYQYCTCFAYLVLAAAAAVVWTLGSEAWRLCKTHRAPDYDRL